jgi:hypothetical protein
MLTLVCLEMVLILVQDRCTFGVERTAGSKIVWTHPMELQGDVGHVESRFGLFGDSARVGARSVHLMHRMNHWLTNHFVRTR